MSAYEPPPPPQARGLRLGDIVRRRPVSDPDDEEPAFPASRRDEQTNEPTRGSQSPRGGRTDEQDSSWRAELKQRRQRQEASDREAAAERRTASERADAERAERARRTSERETAKDARPERSTRAAAADRAEHPDQRRADTQRADTQRAERGADPGAEQRPDRPTVRHVMKPRDPGKHNAPATPVEPARKKPWRKVTKSGAAAGTAGVAGTGVAGAGASAGAGAAPAEAPSWYSRRNRPSAGGADSGASGGGSGIPQVQPPYMGGGGGDAGPSRGPFSGIDLIMLIPAAIAAWYGAGMFVLCAHEAGGRAAFFLWLMMGFWIVIVSAKWPLLRLMRWAWVLAGLMAAASIPIGGG
ncbi:hypothetical protein [Streptomyces sp. SID3343]|uniref:hypothetical protein n=1 Tax=Streptomyces sp. SID3343 TaxID=2690260 RepID=UPI00136E0FD1|nr:hypothetical protein [Streptomyces sp. SID3343]MYW04562.1 hypothetical protein [Streptomyces sp. SID3343]